MVKEKNVLKAHLREERKNRDRSLRQDMIFLTRKVGRNSLAKGYYIQLKELLEDLLMLELAQKAVEATVKYETKDKVISIDDNSLAPFRAEMEKAKTVKMVTGVLSATGYLDVESALSRVEELLYGPKKADTKQADTTISQIRVLLDNYAKRMENLIRREYGKNTK